MLSEYDRCKQADARTRRPIVVTLFGLAFLGLSSAGCRDEAADRIGPQISPSSERPGEDSGTTSTPSRQSEAASGRDGSGTRSARRSTEIPIVGTGPDADDPASDGWDTEAFSAAAAQQLKKLGKFLAHPEQLAVDQLQEFVTDEFTCGPLRPSNLKTAYEDAAFRIEEATFSQAGDQTEDHPKLRGAHGLVKALRGLVAPLASAKEVRYKFKVIRVDAKSAVTTTRVLFEIGGKTNGGSVQQTAEFVCRWTDAGVDGPPRLLAMKVDRYEEVTQRGPTHGMFVDATTTILRNSPTYHEQLAHGIRYWSDRIERRLMRSDAGHHGIAVGDVNGDGLDDVFFCQPGGLPNRLFVQNSDGTARDASAEAAVDYFEPSRSALFLDLDNDADQDLIVATRNALILLANDGTGKFTLKTRMPNVRMTYSLAAADYDGDAYIDLYACMYFPTDDASRLSDFPGLGAVPLPYYDATNGGRNVLLKNDGQWQLTDVTEQSGIDEDNRRWSFAATWEDYDNDGDPDIYVANDFGRNLLYRNDEGRFTNVAAQSAVEDMAFGMSTTWGDYNRDGWMDLYVSNMFSSAGERITYQDQFQQNASAETKVRFQRAARGNTLFENQGDGTFRDVSVDAGVTMGRWAWGSNFVDINNDSWEDLVVANGYYTGFDSGDL